MQTFRLFLLILAVSITGCAQIIQARLSSAKGSIENEREQSYRTGMNTKRILVLADLVDQKEEIKSASGSFSSSLYNTLSSYGYTVKQFEPSSKAERDQYLAKLEADLGRDPGLLVVRLVPKTMSIRTKVNDATDKLPEHMNFAVYAYVGTLRSPAYVYAGDWFYGGDFRFNALTTSVAEHLIKAGYLAKKRD